MPVPDVNDSELFPGGLSVGEKMLRGSRTPLSILWDS
jgi:hypothetical protein